MKKAVITVTLLFSILLSCKSEKRQKYLRYVGDIEKDNRIDNTNFKVCNGNSKILQYFNLGKGPRYNGEKTAILKTFKSKYEYPVNNEQNGFIRIRFVVNCKGKAGRFRVLQADYKYEKNKFDKKIINQLTGITKEIQNWVILSMNKFPIDYYMYLIFKITDGQLTEVLP